jgi:hypothetical protein
MTKISQLSDIGANLAANDEFIIRDVSDASTPNKKVTSSGFIDYVIAQGSVTGFTQIAAGVGPLARALATSSGATGTLTFSTAAATTLIERARIDSSGRLLIGTSTARNDFYNQTGTGALVQLEGIGISSPGYILQSWIVNHNSATVTPHLVIGKSRGSTNGAVTVVQSGDSLGHIDWHGADGTDMVPAASIDCVVDGTPGADDMPGRLVFSTTSDGSASPTERMRIDNAGRVLVGTATANTSGAKLQTSDGLTFPATAVASADPNTLDDYEEGTWTPTIIGSTTAGTATYAVQNARYTKTGRTVFVEALLNYSAGTGTGDLFISGLPFTSANSVTTPAIAVSIFSGITLTAGHILTMRVENANTQIGLYSYPSGGGGYATVAYDGEGVIGLAGSYTV